MFAWQMCAWKMEDMIAYWMAIDLKKWILNFMWDIKAYYSGYFLYESFFFVRFLHEIFLYVSSL